MSTDSRRATSPYTQPEDASSTLHAPTNAQDDASDQVGALSFHPHPPAQRPGPQPTPRRNLLAIRSDAPRRQGHTGSAATSTPSGTNPPALDLTLPGLPHIDQAGRGPTSPLVCIEPDFSDSDLGINSPDLVRAWEDLQSYRDCTLEGGRLQALLPPNPLLPEGHPHDIWYNDPATTGISGLSSDNWTARVDTAWNRWKSQTAPTTQTVLGDLPPSASSSTATSEEDPEIFFKQINSEFRREWLSEDLEDTKPVSITPQSPDQSSSPLSFRFDRAARRSRSAVRQPTTQLYKEKRRSGSASPHRRQPHFYRLNKSRDSAVRGDLFEATTPSLFKGRAIHGNLDLYTPTPTTGSTPAHRPHYHPDSSPARQEVDQGSPAYPPTCSEAQLVYSKIGHLLIEGRIRECFPTRQDNTTPNTSIAQPPPPNNTPIGTMSEKQPEDLPNPHTLRHIVRECTASLQDTLRDALEVHSDKFGYRLKDMAEQHTLHLETLKKEIVLLESRRLRSEEVEDLIESSSARKFREMMRLSEEMSIRQGDILTRRMGEMWEDVCIKVSRTRSPLDNGAGYAAGPNHHGPSPIYTSTQRSDTWRRDNSPTTQKRRERESHNMPCPNPPSSEPQGAASPPAPPTCTNRQPPPIQRSVPATRQAAPPEDCYSQESIDARARLQGASDAGVYMPTPNRPRPQGDLMGSKLDMGYIRPITGPPNQGTYQPPSHSSPHMPNLGQSYPTHVSGRFDPVDTGMKMTSAQMSSFNKPAKFDKPTPYRSASKFLAEFQFYAQALHPDNPRMQALCFYGYLEGRASQWYFINIMNKPIMQNRDILFAAFLQRFSAEDPATLIKGYRNRKQQPKETVEEYCSDMISLLSNSLLDEQTQVDYLMNGLRPEIGNIIRMDTPNSIVEVEKLATKQEMSIASVTGKLKTSPPSLNEIRPYPGSGSSFSSDYRRDSNENRLPSANYQRDYESRYQDKYDNRGPRDDRRGGQPSNRPDSRGRENYRQQQPYRPDSRGRDSYRQQQPYRPDSRGRDSYRQQQPYRPNSGSRDGYRQEQPYRPNSGGRDTYRQPRDGRSASGGREGRSQGVSSPMTRPQDRSSSRGREPQRDDQRSRSASFNRDSNRGNNPTSPNPPPFSRGSTPSRGDGNRDRSRSSDRRMNGGNGPRERSRSEGRSGNQDRSRPSSGTDE